ncbi:MAG: hypothetical protein SFW62_10320 [Alphaproteobacteria bacterium]|nr:hypothetical protein [Alphaproteobacteria bacterium]
MKKQNVIATFLSAAALFTGCAARQPASASPQLSSKMHIACIETLPEFVQVLGSIEGKETAKNFTLRCGYSGEGHSIIPNSNNMLIITGADQLTAGDFTYVSHDGVQAISVPMAGVNGEIDQGRVIMEIADVKGVLAQNCRVDGVSFLDCVKADPVMDQGEIDTAGAFVASRCEEIFKAQRKPSPGF